MAGGLGVDARAVLHSPALGVRRCVIEAADAREGDGRRAHRARLKRHIKIAARKPLAPQARKSVVSGKRVSVRVDLGGRRIIKQNKYIHTQISLTVNIAIQYHSNTV